MVYASFGKRFLAALLDAIILGVCSAILTAILKTSIIGFILFFGYFIYMEGALGATVGKKALGIKVCLENGEIPGYGPAAIRNVLRIVDALPLLYIVGAILVLVTEKHQRVGDMVAKTFVVEANPTAVQ
ncbi:MAG: RDD family protein [Candidatus Saccharibacteria bacterium]